MLMSKDKLQNLLMLTSGLGGDNKIIFKIIYQRVIVSRIFWWQEKKTNYFVDSAVKLSIWI